MKFIQVQSLSEITLLNVAVAVCNNFEDCLPDMPAKMETMSCIFDHWFLTVCDKCLNRIREMASTLQLPKELQTKVAALCKHVYLQMCMWNGSLVQIHSRLVPDFVPRCSCLDQVDFRRYYEWKSIGIIDEKKTVKNLLHDERLDVHFRFVMACYVCSENDVMSLWEIMPEIIKIAIRKFTCTSLPLISFWLKRLDKAADLRDEIVNVIRSFGGNHSAFDCVVNNVTLLQYLLQNHLYDLRKECLRDVACRISKCHQITRFCLFEMDVEEQKIIFQKSSVEVLRSFLEWPWQRHFMKIAHSMFAFLQESDFFVLIIELKCKIVYQWRDYDYEGLLTEFLKHSPTHLKEYIKNKKELLSEFMARRLKNDVDDFDLDL
ncbi:hypothetical protein AVEN_30354-1 [Araneus ventricosus]|uniref:Uncharacterized protein n=1 Tax=Araneus ventricosus TaxID=182803 RepID=A0A4Y2MUS7_ARAVE|nr:hypothetical protein AVEN_30354-1 [Araneus ventricosus]